MVEPLWFRHNGRADISFCSGEEHCKWAVALRN